MLNEGRRRFWECLSYLWPKPIFTCVTLDPSFLPAQQMVMWVEQVGVNIYFNPSLMMKVSVFLYLRYGV